MVTAPPIEGNSDCRARPFHSELYFEIEAIRQQSELRDSFGLLQRYHLERFITPKEFFYPRVAMDFYQSITTQGAQSPTAIHFNIDGRQGILEARHIVEALHIPYEPVDPTHFREWSPISQRDMVRILSRGTSGDSFILRKELSFGMFLIDVLLRSNIFPLQHLVKKLQRADTISLLFPRLLCHILEHMGYPTQPYIERCHHYREHFTLDKWIQLAESVPHAPIAPPMPEATSTDPLATPPVPPAAPPTSEAFITKSTTEFCHLGLLPPPQTYIPGPSEPIAPIEETIRATTEPSSPPDSPAP
ncbi:hypothetical protein AAG906_016734 [Vitis piasezkii]